jgi:hypothetical protein
MIANNYDCQKCGACCISPWHKRQGYVALSRGESKRMIRLGLPVVNHKGKAELGTVPYDAPEGTEGEAICAAFSGVVGRRCACSIHPDRPEECRDLEPGSLKCRMARHMAGLEGESEELTACLRAIAELKANEEAARGAARPHGQGGRPAARRGVREE